MAEPMTDQPENFIIIISVDSFSKMAERLKKIGVRDEAKISIFGMRVFWDPAVGDDEVLIVSKPSDQTKPTQIIKTQKGSNQ